MNRALLHVLPLALAAFSTVIARADERRAWHYTTGGQSFAFYDAGGQKWSDVRPDDKSYIYDERERSEEYVELQNRTTKLIYRLHADRGYWRRESDSDWTRWASGRWGELPADAVVAPAKAMRQPGDYVMRLAYFVPQDRVPVPRYAEKIRVVMAYAASLYRSDLQEKGFKTDGIRFEMKGKLPVVHLIRGDRPAAFYNVAPQYDQLEQWERVVPEIEKALGNIHENLIMVFTET
jgi:hypothetical protein